MKPPVHLDESILTVHDSLGETICSAEVSHFDRITEERRRELRRIVAALNFTAGLSVAGMEQIGMLPLAEALRLSLIAPDMVGPGPGPLGIVKTFRKESSNG